LACNAQAACQRQICTSQLENQTTQYLWHGGMIDAEIEGGQVSKRYIFINLRPVAVIAYENDTNHDQNSQKNKENNSKESNETVGYSAKSSPKSTAIYAIHTDHLGTPQAITDDKQAVVWRADYATFGKATVQARVIDSNTKTAKAATSFGIISSAHAANAATATAKPFEFNLRFAGQYEDTESGYHYNWHRYYDPSTGRYLTPDPIGLAGGLNGYGYAGQDPAASVDPDGLRCTTVGNNVTCVYPPDGINGTSGPNITFPKPPPTAGFNWPDTIDRVSDPDYHNYDINQSPGKIGNCTSADLMPGIIKKPTPGFFTNPATKEGANNNATPKPVQVVLFPGGLLLNPVKSYIIEDDVNKGKFWVVNVTQPGHALFPGYVARSVEDTPNGSIMHNYGEGSGGLQSPSSPAVVRNAINNGWVGLSDDVITAAKCGCK
jgi:RHS repeat-associated protein